ncbi:50S ribosomal protein L22 [Candidatus Gottesmanbacteria bacterium RIFCSPLOWO2_01_FULL_49_10]|uniref:50S ribosomal protein L22 n=1 Tax=Candidatus Gottesmanbacteria bacterium RIFCSPLOWO2_01_FULL_49_10 TaxID=1798396 RepID=A0A1F6AXG1_9BACT|nr:MAG: 50S ribosomal protein L22 [Microgenomates group bacterium GW2011_GWA2_47_8]OGG29366.1 MAG: 50S ribosomal protein L22 [Candidatus Gottesmanbacteria bacterium RIFCSPLOWO2_01_FULL_49_10]
MEYQATAKYIRMSPRKVRLVTDAIKRKMLTPEQALAQLAELPKRAARPVMNVLASAIANAKEKQIPLSALRVQSIEIMGGPSMKRWHAVSRGQAHAYKKRMTHIRVTLTDEKSQ